MNEREWLAKQFEANRTHLRKVAYRMLGSVGEADDAVQQAWLRISRAGARDVDNLSGWLTTIVGRVCLDMLRARAIRREEPFGPHVPEPIDDRNAERDALLADSVGMALVVVLEKLSPPERTAYVLHDMFDLHFDQIAQIVGRSSEATRQLASRARRRIQRGGIAPDADRTYQRELVEAFLTASRNGDFDALLAVLDPHIILRVDRVAARSETALEIRGASAVAKAAIGFSGHAPEPRRPVLVDGVLGLALFQEGRPVIVSPFTIRNGKIVKIEVIADPERLRCLDVILIGQKKAP
jgi:RNA polymerase sigma factor (sigma-70 family)